MALFDKASRAPVGSALKNITIVVLLCLAVSISGTTPVREAAAVSRPNIVFIAADDMRKDDLRWMPKTREFIKSRGITFENAYVTDPLCCPSRATFLTGQYPHNYGILNNIAPSGGFDKVYRSGLEKISIAKKLEDSGYRTALFGKYFNGYCRKDGKCSDPTYVPPGWSEWYAWADESTLNVNGQLKRWTPDDPDFIEDKLIGNRAENFIARNSGNIPMYLHVMPKGPHEYTNPDPKYDEMYKNVRVDTTSPAFNEQDVSDKPPRIKNLPELTSEDISNLNKYYRYRIQLLRTMDDMVYDIIQKLTQEGELSDSYVVFTSDNGYLRGEHRMAYKKMRVYEESIEMPLIIRGPGVETGSSTEKIVANNDFAPTFADIAGESWASDGHSILPLLQGQPYDARERLLIEDATIGYKALRTARWTYAEHDSGAMELCDMLNDPWQLENIHDTASATVKQDLAAKLRALTGCVGAECRRAENGT